jgi:hypothetical protein
MRKSTIAVLGLFLISGGLARAAMLRPLQPTWGLPRIVLGYFAIAITNLLALPDPITIAAPDPDSTPAPQSAGATVTWTESGGHGVPWSLTVAAPATFPGCPTLSNSDVTVTCDSVTVTKTAGGWTGACAGPTPLSTGGVTVASGMEGSAASRDVTVNLHYTFSDSWHHAGGTCSLNLTYTLTAN